MSPKPPSNKRLERPGTFAAPDLEPFAAGRSAVSR